MAWPGPRRKPVQVRLTVDEIADLDRRAAAAGLVQRSGKINRSEMLRRLIAFAVENMPAGYRP